MLFFSLAVNAVLCYFWASERNRRKVAQTDFNRLVSRT